MSFSLVPIQSKTSWKNCLYSFQFFLFSLEEKTLTKVISDLSVVILVVSSVLMSWDLSRAWQSFSVPPPGHPVISAQSAPTSLATLPQSPSLLPHYCIDDWILEAYPLMTSSSLRVKNVNSTLMTPRVLFSVQICPLPSRVIEPTTCHVYLDVWPYPSFPNWNSWFPQCFLPHCCLANLLFTLPPSSQERETPSFYFLEPKSCSHPLFLSYPTFIPLTFCWLYLKNISRIQQYRPVLFQSKP